MLTAPRPSGLEQVKPDRTLAQVEEDTRRLRAEVLRLREREVVFKKTPGILYETPESGMPGSRLRGENTPTACSVNCSESRAVGITAGNSRGTTSRW